MNAYTKMSNKQLEQLHKEFCAEGKELELNASRFGWTTQMLSRMDVIKKTITAIREEARSRK